VTREDKMTEELDAIAFDAGGTLIDLSPSKEEVFYEVMHRNGFLGTRESVTRAITLAERVYDEESASLDGNNEIAFWHRYDKFVFNEVGFKGDLATLSKDLGDSFEEIVQKVGSWYVYPDVVPLLEDLKKRDFKLGIISNATDLLNKVLDNLALTKYFDFVVISAQVGSRKPSKDIFRIAGKKAKTPLSRMLYVGDRYTIDVLGAKRAGMQALLLDRYNVYSDIDCLKANDLNYLRRFLA